MIGYPEEDKLAEDGLYRYLLQPGEEHNDQQCRAMDRVWSKKTYRLLGHLKARVQEHFSEKRCFKTLKTVSITQSAQYLMVSKIMVVLIQIHTI